MKKWAVAVTAALLLLSGCSEKEKANRPGLKKPVKEVRRCEQEEVETRILPYHLSINRYGFKDKD